MTSSQRRRLRSSPLFFASRTESVSQIDGCACGGRVIVAGMKMIPHPRATTLLLVIDLVGTALFAAEGASVAVNARLDLLGVMVIAVVTALGGGILRDVLLGDTPPSSMRDWRYFAIALVAGAGRFPGAFRHAF